MEILPKIEKFFESIWNMNTDQIAIISLIITLLLFVFGKLSENRIKIYESRKEEYQKLLSLFREMFTMVGKDSSKLAKDDKIKQKIYDAGASLAIYGSKRLYRTYCFYRRLSTDENVQKSKWFSSDMVIYSLAEMYSIMRKEVGLNRDLVPIDVPDVLAFFLTDFTKPDFKKKYYKYHFNKFAINSAIFWGKVEDFIPIVWFNNFIIKPLAFTVFCIIRFPIKLLIITPIKQIKAAKSK